MECLGTLLHHPAAVLDAPLRHGHVADGREDVGVEARLASLHGAGLLAALDRVLEVLLAEHPDRSRRAHVSADGRRLLGVECCLGLREDRAGLILGGSAAKHPLPRLALAGRRPEHDLVLVAARRRCVEPHSPGPRTAAHRARLALGEQLRSRGRGHEHLLGWRTIVRRFRVSLSCITQGKVIHVPLVRSHRNGQPSRLGNQPVFAPTRGESSGLVGVGTRGVRRGEAS